MRSIGFLGLLLLAALNAIGLFFAISEHDWKGIALMIFMSSLLVFFGNTLWRGAKLARQSSSEERLFDGWAGESVGSFFRNQVAISVEGRIFIFSSVACFLMALVVLISPQTVSIPPLKEASTAALFGLWPIPAFMLYIKICGPQFSTSLFTILLVVAVAITPFFIAYK